MPSLTHGSITSPIKVLLVDDHRSVLWGLEKLIESERPRMAVVGKATSTTETLALLATSAPDVVLLDLDLNGESGLRLLPAILSQTKARVLVLTGSRDTLQHDDAVLAGARGVVEKGQAAETLLKAIEKVHQGEIWLDRNATGRIFMELAQRNTGRRPDPEQEKIATLSRKERKVVAAIAQNPGASGKVVAEQLFISEHTLRNHLTSVYAKLGLVNRLELYAFARKHGFAEESDE